MAILGLNFAQALSEQKLSSEKSFPTELNRSLMKRKAAASPTNEVTNLPMKFETLLADQSLRFFSKLRGSEEGASRILSENTFLQPSNSGTQRKAISASKNRRC